MHQINIEEAKSNLPDLIDAANRALSDEYS
jgi:antitoxin (DNA-binding transcriptional repressor) of toxin-antitoxin stability system